MRPQRDWEAHRRAVRDRAQRLMDAGMCTQCGAAPARIHPRTGRRLQRCARCGEMHREVTRRWRERRNRMDGQHVS